MSASIPIQSHPILRVAGVVFALVTLLALPGCWVYSVEPLYEERLLDHDPDLVVDQSLVGSWAQLDEECVWILSIELIRDSYALTMAPSPDCNTEDKPTHYEGHLVKLDNHRFLDVAPKSDEVCDLCLPMHSFLLVSQQADRLALIPVDNQWLARALTEKRVGLAHLENHPLETMVVLTASTRELKEFARKYADDGSVFKADSEVKLRFKRR